MDLSFFNFSEIHNDLKNYAGFFISIVLIMLCSCSTPKKVGYFRTLTKDTVISGFVTNTFESKIQRKDVLSISTSSLSKEMDDAFNSAASSVNVTSTIANSAPGYTVDEKGNILIHFIGVLHVEGLTRKELQQKLETLLLPYMKEPIITVQYLNHKVTVMGNVISPQVINMPGEQMPLLDVIVSSGGVKDNPEKNDVMVIRENGTEKQVKHINLDDHSLLTSTWYYVQPNDIVYVLPDQGKVNKDERRRTLQTTLSLVATVVSLVIIILNNLIK